jgi:hypothetical protein
MRALNIPRALQEELATVVAVWESGGATTAVDALILTWVKYEKQLRRLFAFLVFQHPEIDKTSIMHAIAIIAANSKLNPQTLTKAINALKAVSIEALVGESHGKLTTEIDRIKGIRNKLVHGQITGKNLTTHHIQSDVCLLIDWITALAAGSKDKFGYDGLSRNTFVKAKAANVVQVSMYPFLNTTEFAIWLNKITK